ncbi:aminodeoxychorismate synthase component I [Amycolatopsis cihanbeyliensis]|uniref:aminodeoxychorismate synthase n=1 Tax=Amycolatopsis cihanbeyliensis TaxID=1128664 RepID=A0A542DEX7_AMYCI|nr:aminodeoxychorismate synthase component I [Amycolatopsis cihanbeyliensis]TQJ01638.1 para-aminobenzoate synthetase [Amycolatopsis cihanbeyliensis]
MKTLIVDNYDSFTYNLAHLVGQVRGVDPIVVQNNVSWASIPWSEVDNVVISPGPGKPNRPEDFGICAEIIARCELPILGVCLGHQGICKFAGARVAPAPVPMHGSGSLIQHDGVGLFAGIPSPFIAIRYHSLAADDIPDTLRVTATSEDGVVMAVEHVSRPIWGVQFHPESICTEYGREIIVNFCRLTESWADRPRVEANSGPRFTINLRRVPKMPDPDTIFSELFTESTYSFWLDSGGPATDHRARFSILGDAAGPLAEVVEYDVEKSELTSLRHGRRHVLKTSIFEYLADRCAEVAPASSHGLDLEFELGFVGFLGYEMKAETGGSLTHRNAIPDAAFVFADRAVVHDARDGSGWLLALSCDGAPDASPGAVARWLDQTADRLQRMTPRVRSDALPDEGLNGVGRVEMRHDYRAYLSRIERTLELIRSGETYELCLTNEGSVTTDADPVTLYEETRRLNPAPFGALLRFGTLSVLSASPERFMSVTGDGSVESRPIKGTRPRSEDPVEDERIRARLQASKKDRAENLMIVDLVRNDLSRVCEVGSVHVPALFDVETFATVHQLVSTVAGQLSPGMTAIDAVRAAFPGGSMTGAPKLRTMELIDELEGGPRGVYSGALGWFSLTGACDLSIVIRTITMNGPDATFGTGGAILALSDPEEEWEETRVKSTVMCSVLESLARHRCSTPEPAPR